jgi:rubrerythrin
MKISQKEKRMDTSNLLDAIRIVKENERIASESYANAAKKIDTLGKMIFEQLSEFEKFHYDQLTILEKSLLEKGDFINYQGKAFVLPPILEVKFAEEPYRKSILDIISEAMKFEQQAEKAYADLAAQLTDPLGHQMFIRLSKEERNHYDILTDAYWSLNETGVWKWSRPKMG